MSPHETEQLFNILWVGGGSLLLTAVIWAIQESVWGGDLKANVDKQLSRRGR